MEAGEDGLLFHPPHTVVNSSPTLSNSTYDECAGLDNTYFYEVSPKFVLLFHITFRCYVSFQTLLGFSTQSPSIIQTTSTYICNGKTIVP